ncbi:tripartite tricarboxylate transporter substrate binding protein [Alcaligenaceae bacterium]|nr:tripartite tricarboxylate transporter substrate binding protein [Alcaligenaceae bacterium]
MYTLFKKILIGAGACLALAGIANAAYPEKPIRMVVSFPPGSGTDTNARYAAKKLSERIGVPVVVENRPGANSFIAAEAVVSAAPDGYTLLLASNSPVTTNVVMFEKLPYDPVKQLTPIAKLAYGPMALAVHKDSPFKTVQDLVDSAKSNPNSLNYGGGSASYRIATELFLTQNGIKAEFIPYKGASPALTDLAGGHVDFVFADLGAVIPFEQSGNMRILAVTGNERVKSVPDVPTLQEAGTENYYMINWTAAFAPAGTPQPIVNMLSEHFVEIYKEAEAQEFLDRTNWFAFPAGAEELGKFQLSEIERWGAAAKAADIPKQ